MRRRYEVWFLRVALADGSGAWWFRYLLTNPGRGGCAGAIHGLPVQVWATWFPAGGKPQTFIQQLPLSDLKISGKGQSPLHFQASANEIGEDFCRGDLNVDGHTIAWNLRYRSTLHVTLSSKGWIGFSRTPHSDAVFSGEITLDGNRVAGDPLGFGLQGHNCGYRHRNFWRWTHAYFSRNNSSGGTSPASTFEALVYEMPFGLVFRKAVLWHDGREHVFRKLREKSTGREELQWNFSCDSENGIRLEAAIDGRGPSIQRLPYMKTDCSGTFEVINNSLASASIVIESDGASEKLQTSEAVLEIVG